MRLVQGWGINDMPYGWRASSDLNKKIYDTWYCMIQRCYDPKSLTKYPTYIGCFVNDRWKYLSNFVKDVPSIPVYQRWSVSPKNTMALDKDILVPGNKEYGPGLVCFVDIGVNTIEMNKRTKSLPIEVSLLDGTQVRVFYNGAKEVAQFVGCSKDVVYNVINGRTKSVNGYLIKRL